MPSSPLTFPARNMRLAGTCRSVSWRYSSRQRHRSPASGALYWARCRRCIAAKRPFAEHPVTFVNIFFRNRCLRFCQGAGRDSARSLDRFAGAKGGGRTHRGRSCRSATSCGAVPPSPCARTYCQPKQGLGAGLCFALKHLSSDRLGECRCWPAPAIQGN